MQCILIRILLLLIDAKKRTRKIFSQFLKIIIKIIKVDDYFDNDFMYASWIFRMNSGSFSKR